MTADIALVLALLLGAVILFVLERPRPDVVALMMLGALAVTGLLEPHEALSGFSNPAVITVWAVFMISGGLSRAGVAHLVGRQVLRLGGAGEARLIVAIMSVAAVLSAFMNNVGATALLLPVVMNIARQTGVAPSKLLLPLSFGSLLGGNLTLIGTPPNILIAEAASERGLGELGLFAFAPVGGAVLIAGVAYMVLFGRRLLPSRDLVRESQGPDLRAAFGLHKRLLVLHVPAGSTLVGRTIADARIASALGLTVIGILRGGRTLLAPSPVTPLRPGDRLLVEGRPTRLEELRGSPALSLVGEEDLTLGRVVAGDVEQWAVRVTGDSDLIDRSLRQLDFRHRVGGAVVVGLQRGGTLRLHRFDDLPLADGDVLLVQASGEELQRLAEVPGVEQVETLEIETSALEAHLMRLELPPGSVLAGRTLAESRLAEGFGLQVLTLDRGGERTRRPAPDEVLAVGDVLVVKGSPESLEVMRGLQSLQVERDAQQSLEAVESSEVGLSVVAIAPSASVANRTLRGLRFREKYGLSVLAVWRQGRIKRSRLAGERLRYGDALLVHGPREKLRLLAREPDFIVLSADVGPEVARPEKAPLALAILGGVVAAALTGWLPIYVAAPIGGTLMVLTGCLRMDEAYREIEWRAVFLIAGMLPLGLAMEKTGAAVYVAELVVAAIGGFGPLAVLAGLFLLAVAGAQVMPTPAVALLLAPIAIDTAAQIGVSPLSLVMGIAVGASTSFISPVTHPANVLVMGPGGYRLVDYVKVGTGLTVVVLAVVVLVVPWVWPFAG
ncbi:MAG TPA: SLC13 family permease [Thermoanaerobaculia bacterium]|nr:SLC13 family permease [Thermoanaerobaculia bacterium]